jgi:rRNA maturation endonuclease Nob1
MVQPESGKRPLLLIYEFLCHNCRKLFSKVLSRVEYEEADVCCPYCGSKDVEQCRTAFPGIARKKSA